MESGLPAITVPALISARQFLGTAAVSLLGNVVQVSLREKSGHALGQRCQRLTCSAVKGRGLLPQVYSTGEETTGQI